MVFKNNMVLSTNTIPKLWKWKLRPENTTDWKNCSNFKSTNINN